MRNLILLIIGNLLLLTGCANLDVAQEAYKKGDYNKTIAIYKEWAKKGFPQAQLKLAQIANKGIIKTSPDFIIKNALNAYNKGYKEAANLLFYNYYKLGKIDKAKVWIKYVIFEKMNQKMIDAYLEFIQYHIKKPSLQFKYIQNLQTYALKFSDIKALYALGKFYENSVFINLQKSAYYYKLAWKQGYIPAGIKLALLYIYKLNKPQKGINLLKKLANKDNGTSAYNIAIFLLNKMNKELQKLNTPCISFSFKTPKEFFIKKIQAKLFEKMFLDKNIAPWLNFAYKKGYIAAKLKLIAIDLEMRNFDKKTNLSHLNLNEAINYLNQLNFFKAKLLLARIYETYPNLHQLLKARLIYEEYVNKDKIQGYWHLYQFYKRFYPQNKQKNIYLNYLVKNNFTPAIIEKAYFSILNKHNVEKNMKILQFFAEQNNILALTYLSSIYAINNQQEKNKKALQKLCHLTSPINPPLDLKIAKYYLKEQNIDKAATIYQYYAQQNIPQAAFMLSKIYKALGECKKNLYWLKISKDQGMKQAELIYAKLVLSGKIEGNITKSLAILTQYATNNDPVSLTFLGDIYKQGIVVKFNPIKAEQYYKKAIALGYTPAYLKLIDLYKLINIYGQYNKKILNLYNELLKKTNSDYIKLQIAQFLFDNKEYKKAYKFILQNKLYRYDQGKYLTYLITGKIQYSNKTITKPKITSDPKLLLVYAKQLEKTNKKEALYYAFLAAFNNINGSSAFIVRELKFFSPSTVRKIYKKAKSDYLKEKKFNIEK